MSEENEGRQEEIVGGLKNAIERGQDIVSAQKSFINAGYLPQEVSLAAQKISSSPVISPRISSSTQTSAKFTSQSPPSNNIKNTSLVLPVQEKKPKILFWILLITSALILIIALLLGLYWDKIF